MGWPSLSDIRSRVDAGVNRLQEAGSNALQGAQQLGGAALSRAQQLGQQGADLGRRFVDNPDRTVREVAGAARQGIAQAGDAAQQGIRSGVGAVSRGIGTAAEAARGAIPGDNVVSNAARTAISNAERNARFTVGVGGGVLIEGAGLLETAGQLGVGAAELQLSPSARAELGQRVLDGGRAAASYASAAVQDPGRVGRDVQSAAQGAWGSASRFVDGKLQQYDQALRTGQVETIGIDVGRVGSNFIPVGAGAKLASTTARGAIEVGARTAVRESTEALVREGTQAAVEQGTRAAVREGGEAVARQSPNAATAVSETAGSIRTINPAYPAKGNTHNCVECVIATERRFAGQVDAAAKATSGPLPISRITAELGGKFERVSGMMEVGQRLRQAGDGSRGIVYGADHARGFGHVWNVRLDKGVVTFLDSQPGKRAGLGVDNFGSFTDFQFLLTATGKKL